MNEEMGYSYYFEGKDGIQMAFWMYYSDRESKEQTHAFGGKRIQND